MPLDVGAFHNEYDRRASRVLFACDSLNRVHDILVRHQMAFVPMFERHVRKARDRRAVWVNETHGVESAHHLGNVSECRPRISGEPSVLELADLVDKFYALLGPRD